MSQRSCSFMVFMVAGLVVLRANGAWASIVIDTVPVGNPGNAADPLNTGSVPGIGSVDYEYRIAATEVTNAQYVAFLNAVDAAGTNPNAIYNISMGINAHGGISVDAGAPSGSKYIAKANMSNKPVNFVSFFDSMRFVNWLNNGQGAGGMETGVYNISDGLSETRAADAQFFIPTENEWYKAAYHQPAAHGGDVDDYWLYPTRSNSSPIIATATAIGDIANPGANVANYNAGANWNGQVGTVTTVGSAGPLSASYYGTFDQGGNVWEWNETLVGFEERGVRGGSFVSTNGDTPRSSVRGSLGPTFESADIGFRVASAVPEPGSLSLLLVGVLGLVRRRRAQRTSSVARSS